MKRFTVIPANQPVDLPDQICLLAHMKKGFKEIYLCFPDISAQELSEDITAFSVMTGFSLTGNVIDTELYREIFYQVEKNKAAAREAFPVIS